MTLSYPRTIPTTLKTIQKITWRQLSVNGFSRSPYTLASQVIEYGAAAWQADCVLPPMKRIDAEAWIGFILSLRGRRGSFLLWDPANSTPRGTATSATLTASDGADSGTFTMTGSLRAGDMFQLGASESATLHKMVADRSGTGTGTFWPPVRRTITDEDVVLNKACGVFQLVSNTFEWDVDAVSGYGVTFAVQEKIT